MRPHHLKAHQLSKHPTEVGQPVEYFSQKKRVYLNQQKSFSLFTQSTDLKSYTLASYDVSLHIARLKKPHTDEETLIKPSMLACAKHVLGSEAAEKLKKIPLSNDTVKRRIREISENLEDQLVGHIKDIPISIHLDESTFGADSTLIVCIRFIENECIKEELLFVDYFECRCTGQDIFKMVRSYFYSQEMKLSQVVSVSTDGARNMTGRETGFWGCFKREVPQCSFIHCMLHKQALAAKNIQSELHETLNLVIKVVNFVKSSPLNERILIKLCEDSDAEHDALLFHTDVRCLVGGTPLNACILFMTSYVNFLLKNIFSRQKSFHQSISS